MPYQVAVPKGSAPPLAPYSPGAKGGNALYVSGTLALDSAGNLVGKGDVKAQTRHILETIKAVVEAAGGSLKDITFNHIFLSGGCCSDHWSLQPYGAQARDGTALTAALQQHGNSSSWKPSSSSSTARSTSRSRLERSTEIENARAGEKAACVRSMQNLPMSLGCRLMWHFIRTKTTAGKHPMPSGALRSSFHMWRC